MDANARLIRHLTAALQSHLAGRRIALPEAGVALWNIFMDLSATRTYHAAGPHAISHGEIAVYCQLNRWPLESHHLAAIRALDDAWLSHVRSTIDQPAGTSARPKQAVTAQAFDAVFG